MKILHLTLKKKWFDMIASGEKKEEYREIKMHWASRLMTGFPNVYGIERAHPDFKDFDTVKFAHGYGLNRPFFYIECLGIEMRGGHVEWGAEPGKTYFVIKLGEIIP